MNRRSPYVIRKRVRRIHRSFVASRKRLQVKHRRLQVNRRRPQVDRERVLIDLS